MVNNIFLQIACQYFYQKLRNVYWIYNNFKMDNK